MIRFFGYRILHVDDTPQRIALGVAIGLFVTWTPTIGFQMALTVALCTLLRANKVVGVPFVWISNPATIVPIYYPNYLLGVYIVPGGRTVTLEDWRRMASAVFLSDHGWLQRVGDFWSFVWNIAAPLWIGSIVLGLVVGAIGYVLTYNAVTRYRLRLKGRSTRKT